MITRRNIRTKVMQVLYACEQNTPSIPSPEKTIQESRKLFETEIKQSASLFYFMLTYVCRIAAYVKTDAEKRSSKYLPTAEDKNVNTRLAENKELLKLLANEDFQRNCDSLKVATLINEDWVKKLYRQLIQTSEYVNYLSEEKSSAKTDSAILLFIWSGIILQNEDFLNDLAEDWINWEDDADLMKILIGNYFNQPKSFAFSAFISKEKKEYAFDLIQTVIEKQDYLMELIQPKLKNWEAERIAQIDLVLLKMGLAEFLYFPTIPAKVTINEYIDIAKDYSTEQSGQFINGVLDNLRKDLEKENKLRKIQHIK